MVASREVEIPVYKGIGQQRGRDSLHLHRQLGELQHLFFTITPFYYLKK